MPDYVFQPLQDDSNRMTGKNGTKANPIVICGSSDALLQSSTGGNGQRGLFITRCEWVVVSGLTMQNANGGFSAQSTNHRCVACTCPEDLQSKHLSVGSVLGIKPRSNAARCSCTAGVCCVGCRTR